jgi:ferric-dicitrate binding protein FerR (iron transport regulator)
MGYNNLIMLQRLAFLFDRYLSRRSTPGEVDELMTLIEDPDNKEMVQLLLDQVVAATGEEHDLSNESADAILAAIFSVEENQKGEAPVVRMPSRVATPVVPMRSRIAWKVWLAAASVLFLLALGGYFLLFHRTTAPSEIASKAPDKSAPKSTRATITLADGREVVLDSVNAGTLAVQGAANVVKNDQGEISYQLTSVSGLDQQPVAFNTLFNPRGSKVVSLTLVDGTKVWLNSESSLKYPTAFNGNTREVEITGEAYFDVAHNAAKPFHVRKGSADITVLGTHFNVNAYDDEEVLKVTLLEGSVKLSAPGAKQLSNSIILKPGEQGQLQTTNYKLQTINGVDIDAVVAWKNGFFSLQGTDVYSLMKQVSRWYDVDVVYTGTVPARKFGGSVSRDVNLSDVLNALREYGINIEYRAGKVYIR